MNKIENYTNNKKNLLWELRKSDASFSIGQKIKSINHRQCEPKEIGIQEVSQLFEEWGFVYTNTIYYWLCCIREILTRITECIVHQIDHRLFE